MKSDRLFILICAAILVVAFFFSCSNQLAGGDVTETGNARVCGKIVDTFGNGMKNVHVQLLPSYFDPVRGGIPLDSLSTSTDENGNYVINTSIIGNYNIEAVNSISGDRALICNIDIKINDTIYNEIAILKKTGTVKIVLPSDSISGVVYAYIPGTTHFGTINGRIVIIDSVPAGSFTALCYVNKTDTAENRTYKKEFSVISGCTAIITDNQSWLFSSKLYFNTTSSGAAVNKNVYSFPVLIRLSTDNFDFSQAKKGGEDIRFAKVDGSQLPYEIERWDASARRAEIWVRIDTVYGNDSSHGFIMYWGASTGSAAQSLSNGPAVFDTANGFAGVWHFAEADNNLPGGFKDATANAYNLTGATRTTAGYVDGIIGGAQKFGMVASDSIVGPCPEKLSGNSSITVSFWIKVDTLLPSRPCILDFGKASYIAGSHFFIWPDYTAQFGMFDTGGFLKPSDPEPPHQNVFSIKYSSATWMYIVSAYDASAGTLTSYVNGTVMDRDTMSAIRIDIAGGLHIGRPYASYYPGYFGGSLDEVRILSIPESEERIRLSYLNESPGNTFIKFK